MLAIRQSDYAAACGGLTLRLVSMHFAGLPFTRRGKWRLYALADVLPCIKKKYLPGVPTLLQSAVDDGQTYVGGDEVLPSCNRLEEWLRANVPGAESRLWQARTAFFDALTASKRVSAPLLLDPERQRLLILRNPAILRFVLSDDRSGLPASCDEWGRFSYLFSILHSAQGPILSEAPMAA